MFMFIRDYSKINRWTHHEHGFYTLVECIMVYFQTLFFGTTISIHSVRKYSMIHTVCNNDYIRLLNYRRSYCDSKVRQINETNQCYHTLLLIYSTAYPFDTFIVYKLQPFKNLSRALRIVFEADLDTEAQKKDQDSLQQLYNLISQVE